MFVKICGLNHEEAVAAALEAGADALGFVLAPSVRRVSAQEAARLAEPARGRAWCVAVTQHPLSGEAQQILDVFAPDLLQTDHADASNLPTRALDRLLPVYRENETLPAHLPDCLVFEGARSGVGKAVDWDLARSLASRTRVLLAGGLDPDNVGEAIQRVRPWGVDVSSGVESSPGRKCPKRIQEFVKAARAAFGEWSE